MNFISDELVRQNNARILSAFRIQPRYRREFEEQEKKEKLTADERRLLMAISIYQYKLTLTQITGVAGFSACKSDRLFKALEKSEMIKIVSIVKGKGISKFPVLLDPAYKLLNLEEKKFYGKGAGYEHLVWQFLIAEHFKERKAEIELNKSGKFIDVAVDREGKLIAIEVAMTSIHEKENTEKDINLARADFVIIACKDKKVKEEVMQIITGLPEEMRHKTTVLLLSEILKKDFDELINQNKNQEE
ncbi:MAG: hypothetical protein V1762_00745 [Nitrospirota bacterium]